MPFWLDKVSDFHDFTQTKQLISKLIANEAINNNK